MRQGILRLPGSISCTQMLTLEISWKKKVELDRLSRFAPEATLLKGTDLIPYLDQL